MITTHNHRSVRRHYYLAFLALIALTLPAPTQANYTYVVGNLASGSEYVDTNHGPTADANFSTTRVMGKTVAYHTETGLRELVVYNWQDMGTVNQNGYAYCNATDEKRLRHAIWANAGRARDVENQYHGPLLRR